MVSARVAGGNGELGPDFDHMALVVAVPGETTRYLVDVGFGDAFTRPIPMIDRREQEDRDRLVRVRDCGHGAWSYDERRTGDADTVGWKPQYVFTTEARRLAEFSEMNEHQQWSPDSHFRNQPVCSLLTDGGRITVSADRLIETSLGGGRHETTLSVAERTRTLRDRFGIEVDGDFDALRRSDP